MAQLPASFAKDGFSSIPQRKTVRLKNGKTLKPIMIGMDGLPDTGKTEFAHSAPGPGMIIVLDRGLDGMLDNPNPPESRSPDFAYRVISTPLDTQGSKNLYLEYWSSFYKDYRAMLENPDCVTAVIDGDSDSWELQRLAEFGRLTQIPAIMYTSVNAARRVMYARAWDSGKIIIATNKVKREYRDVIDPTTGKPKEKDGRVIREITDELERQGFGDQEYLWTMQLRTFVRDGQYGIRIMKCKPNRDLIGLELVGEDCNFGSLVQVVYPDVPMENWGF